LTASSRSASSRSAPASIERLRGNSRQSSCPSKWPVTPEVAGSSPVALVKEDLQIAILCCQSRHGLIRFGQQTISVAFDEIFRSERIRILRTPVRRTEGQRRRRALRPHRTLRVPRLAPHPQHYNTQRPHRALGLRPPDPDANQGHQHQPRYGVATDSRTHIRVLPGGRMRRDPRWHPSGRLSARAGRHRPGAVQPCRSRRALPLVRASRSARHRCERVKRCPCRRTAPRSPA